MTDPDLNLSIDALARACRGNVNLLPSFMIHDDAVWPWKQVKTDNRGRVHMRRSTFERTVVGNLPLRPGVWHRIDVQEFHIDLQPHHLQGSDGMGGGDRRAIARMVARIDEGGRGQGDEGYGEAVPRGVGVADLRADLAEAEARGTRRGVRSTVFGGDGAGERKVGVEP